MPAALVIADSQWVFNDVQAALAVADWELSTLNDPHRAGEVTYDSAPDAVIVDMQVDSMGGMAIVRAIRAAFQDATPPRTVLLLDRSADKFLARRAMADAWVVKPFLAAELRRALQASAFVSGEEE